MPFWALAAKPQRSAVLAESARLRRVNPFRHLDPLRATLGAQRGQDSFGSKGYLT
jgi:hypothetical protein